MEEKILEPTITYSCVCGRTDKMGWLTKELCIHGRWIVIGKDGKTWVGKESLA